MSDINKVHEFIRDHPTANNTQIAKETGIPERSVKVYIHRLRKRGQITIDGAGDNRRVITHSDPGSFKKDVYYMMVETYLEDFKEAELFRERVEIGKMIARLMENL